MIQNGPTMHQAWFSITLKPAYTSNSGVLICLQKKVHETVTGCMGAVMVALELFWSVKRLYSLVTSVEERQTVFVPILKPQWMRTTLLYLKSISQWNRTHRQWLFVDWKSDGHFFAPLLIFSEAKMQIPDLRPIIMVSHGWWHHYKNLTLAFNFIF